MKACGYVVLAGFLIGSSTVPAQQRVIEGTSGEYTRIARPEPTNATTAPDVAARIVTRQFAECTVRHGRASVVKALQLAPFGKKSRDRLVALPSDDCPADVGMAPLLFRGALFGVLYREATRDGPPTLLLQPLDFAEGASPPFEPEQREAIATRQFADCVVRRDLTHAHVAVVAEPGSQAETAAFAALSPHLGACLPQGMTIKFSRSMLSGLFAEVMYRQISR
jgi:hypothetical protein